MKKTYPTKTNNQRLVRLKILVEGIKIKKYTKTMDVMEIVRKLKIYPRLIRVIKESSIKVRTAICVGSSEFKFFLTREPDIEPMSIAKNPVKKYPPSA